MDNDIGVSNAKTSKSIFKRITQKYNESKEAWNFAIGIFVTLLGIFVSIMTIIYDPNNFVIAISIIGCQVIVCIMCIITFVSFNKNKELLKEAENENTRVLEEAEGSIKVVEKTSELNWQLTKKILVFSKNINKRINNFLTLICDESDKYYCSVGHIKEKLEAKKEDQDYAELCKAQLEDARQKYRNSLFSLYNRYVKGVFEETLSAINMDLKSKDIVLNVSMSLKLFDFTYRASEDHKKMQIYTAFRDKDTYDNNKEREIGERHYHVALNGDFHTCLSKESYIKNNIKNIAEDYLNENFPNCMRFYNCTAVVPIICDYKSDKQIYGFFCCDSLNDKYDKDIFDKNTCDILYSAALTLGMFFDNINSAWTYIVDSDEQDFLSYLHKQIYKNRG